MLIKSLTKAEKRNFKLYVNRFSAGGDTKFLQLFDVLDKMIQYEEDLIFKKLPEVKKKNLANHKRHLYKQLLTSLRLIHINKEIDIQIREQIDFARILYGKGMYMQSLRILERIKKIAADNHQDILHIEIVEFQKLIETRHVTRSRVAGKIEDLLKDSNRRSFIVYASSLFSNLNIQMHGWYIQNGHAIEKEDKESVKQFYRKHLPDQLKQDRMTFHEKINLYQANMWYYYILLDFKRAQEFALAWLNQFEAEQTLMEKDPDLYMRGFYYLLILFYFENSSHDYDYYLNRFEQYITARKEQFNENSEMIAFTYYYLSKINGYFLEDSFDAVVALKEELYLKIERFQSLLDPNRTYLMFYKIAYAHFRLKEFNECLEMLNEIVHESENYLRNDLRLSARTLLLLCHFELENYDLVGNLLSNLMRTMASKDKGTPLQIAFLKCLRQLLRQPISQHNKMLLQFKEDQEALFNAAAERRSMRFFDFRDWINQKQLSKIAVEN